MIYYNYVCYNLINHWGLLDILWNSGMLPGKWGFYENNSSGILGDILKILIVDWWALSFRMKKYTFVIYRISVESLIWGFNYWNMLYLNRLELSQHCF